MGHLVHVGGSFLYRKKKSSPIQIRFKEFGRKKNISFFCVYKNQNATFTKYVKKRDSSSRFVRLFGLIITYPKYLIPSVCGAKCVKIQRITHNYSIKTQFYIYPLACEFTRWNSETKQFSTKKYCFFSRKVSGSFGEAKYFGRRMRGADWFLTLSQKISMQVSLASKVFWDFFNSENNAAFFLSKEEII